MGAQVRIGDVLAEKYEVTRLLGVGGMGVVVAAHHRELDKLVALKFMHEAGATDEQAIDRFLREARAAARLQNEHVGRVLDVGRLPDGVPYIVMEYLEGCDLALISEQRGPLEVAETVEYVLQACEAMAEAHALGIIHRDLKPQNLFVTMRLDGRPLVKVLDFGISKSQLAPGPTVTQQAMGSPAYMPPEQMRSARSVDPRADIWSLGVILYQLLAGSLPFDGETIAETMLKVMSEPAPPLALARPGLPPGLVAVVERCLEKDRARRFDNVAELARELMRFADSRAPGIASGAGAGARSLAGGALTTLGAATSHLDAEPRRPARWRWIGVTLLGIATMVAISMFVMRSDGAWSPAAAPTEAAAVTVDATQRAADGATAPAAPLDAPVDAPPTESPDAPAQIVAPGRHTRRTRARISIDAGTSKPIDAGISGLPDALTLEPARTTAQPLIPAREKTR